jgi:transposase-like protein
MTEIEQTRTGRPCKLTPEVQAKICQAIRAGNYSYVAAEYAGIGASTYHRWMQQGEQETSGSFREFRDAVKSAESEAEVRAVAIIQRHMEKNWQAAMTYLERKHPQRWGRRLDHTTAGRPVTKVEIVMLDPETGEETPFKLPPIGRHATESPEG